MKRFQFLSAVVLIASLVFSGQAAERQKLETDVAGAIKDFEKADSGLSDTFKKAAGYAVFPNVGKGGFILGGAHGRGLVYQGGELIGQATLTQISVGAQVGGQEFAEAVLFETAEALARFKESRWVMSAQVSAVVAAEGASEKARYVEGVMVFTRPKQGLMAEASVGGQKFKFSTFE